MRREITWACWTLRGGVALEFLGHGWLAFTVNPGWIHFVTFWGIPVGSAPHVMHIVGLLDMFLALHVLVRPLPPLVGWMAFWGLFTATLRPLTGGMLVEFVERGANFGAPLALLLLLRANRANAPAASE